MKTLMLLILFTSIAAGQERTTEVKPYEERMALPDTIQPPTEAQITKMLSRHYSVGVLLSLYSRYEKECYDDSTLTNGAIFRTWNSGSEWWVQGYRKDAETMDVNFVRWESRWLHRAPSFPGFIEFLRRTK